MGRIPGGPISQMEGEGAETILGILARNSIAVIILIDYSNCRFPVARKPYEN